MKHDMRPHAKQGAEARHKAKEKRQREAADEFPPLTSVENAQRRLDLISKHAAAGTMAGSQAGAAARAVEIWLKAEQHKLDLHRIKDLERMIGELERELKKAKAGHLRAV